jgi:hypothetical protein
VPSDLPKTPHDATKRPRAALTVRERQLTAHLSPLAPFAPYRTYDEVLDTPRLGPSEELRRDSEGILDQVRRYAVILLARDGVCL